jgi:peptide/nickel transport system permease protein
MNGWLQARESRRGLLLFSGVALLVAAAGWLAPRSPIEVALERANLPPLSDSGPWPPFWLGTDALGRDVLSRLLYGGRTSLLHAAGAELLALGIGLSMGCAAALRGRAVALAVELALQVFGAIPYVLLALAVRTQLGAGPWALTLALAAGGWLTTARMVRGQVRVLKGSEALQAAVLAGASGWQRLGRHILPALRRPLAILGSWGLARMLLAESALSFLGLGVPPPAPSWGHMLAVDLLPLLAGGPAWWAALFPGAALVITILSLHWVGDGLAAGRGFASIATKPTFAASHSRARS